MKSELQKLAASWERDANAYHDMFPVPEGSTPKDLTTEQQNAVNLSGICRVHAHDLKQILKKFS